MKPLPRISYDAAKAISKPCGVWGWEAPYVLRAVRVGMDEALTGIEWLDLALDNWEILYGTQAAKDDYYKNEFTSRHASAAHAVLWLVCHALPMGFEGYFDGAEHIWDDEKWTKAGVRKFRAKLAKWTKADEGMMTIRELYKELEEDNSHSLCAILAAVAAEDEEAVIQLAEILKEQNHGDGMTGEMSRRRYEISKPLIEAAQEAGRM